MNGRWIGLTAGVVIALALLHVTGIDAGIFNEVTGWTWRVDNRDALTLGPGGQFMAGPRIHLGDESTDIVQSVGVFLPRRVDDPGMEATPGVWGEIVFNEADSEFYGYNTGSAVLSADHWDLLSVGD